MEKLDIQENIFGKRLNELRTSLGMRVKDFYLPVTPHVSNCSAIEHGKRPVGKRLLDAVIDQYGVSSEWLYDGIGEMFDEEKVNRAQHSMSPLEQGVPFFNVNLSELSFDSFSALSEPPEYYVNFRPFNDCDAYLPIYGDSMYPRYASGEIIAVREIRNFDVIQWGEAYMLIADERANGITTVKLLFEHPNEKKIVLRSSNPNFKGDTIIDREMIKRLFIVKGKVTRHHL